MNHSLNKTSFKIVSILSTDFFFFFLTWSTLELEMNNGATILSSCGSLSMKNSCPPQKSIKNNRNYKQSLLEFFVDGFSPYKKAAYNLDAVFVADRSIPYHDLMKTDQLMNDFALLCSDYSWQEFISHPTIKENIKEASRGIICYDPNKEEFFMNFMNIFLTSMDSKDRGPNHNLLGHTTDHSCSFCHLPISQNMNPVAHKECKIRTGIKPRILFFFLFTFFPKVQLERNIVKQKLDYVKELEIKFNTAPNKQEIHSITRQTGRVAEDESWNWEEGSSQLETQHFDFGHAEALGTNKTTNKLLRNILSSQGIFFFFIFF
jgi:hypothetical protein